MVAALEERAFLEADAETGKDGEHRRHVMTPRRLADCLRIIHWTQRGLARTLERSESSVRQWLAGTVSVPTEVGEWLERLTATHECNPPPVRQREEVA